MSDSEILLTAQQLPTEQRAAWVAQACGDDVERAGRILEQLAKADSGDRLDPFATRSISPEALSKNDGAGERPWTPDATIDFQSARSASTGGDLKAGIIVGPFRLIQRLGAGGMGEVWMAQQTHPVKRQVALKVIKQGLGSREILARFEAERQALALMNHPSIARILDAGSTPEGQPWFAMELVQGQPFTNWCDENRLGIDERLELFSSVCDGVQHAHQKGIIHRDLKPSNILVTQVDGKPVPKIIDFGLAKAMDNHQRLTDQSLFTGIGQILGTFRYMSPEQASLDNLDIDTRADIYSLGVILYELLTGSTPLDDSSIRGQAALKVLEFIREKDPVKPSSRLGSSTDEQISTITGQRRTDSGRLSRILAGDLDWIVMKALEKDRNRRYESASGFAADIRRYLNSEPVIARPPSLNYRLRKFVRKNRVGVIAASMVLMSLTGGIVGTSLAMVRAWDAEKVSEERRQDAEREKQVADTKRLEAERNLAFAKKGNEILGSVFADLDPFGVYRDVSDLRDALRDNLEYAVSELKSGSIGNAVEVAEMQTTLGRSLMGLGQFSQAVPLFQQSFDTRKLAMGSDAPKTLVSQSHLGVAQHYAGDFQEGIRTLENTVAKMQAVLGREHADTLVNMTNLAMAYNSAGKWDQAITICEAALPLKRRHLGDSHRDTLTCMNNLATAYRDAGRLDSAIRLQQESLELTTATQGEDDPDTLTNLSNLGEMLAATGSFDKAILLLKKAVAGKQDTLGDDHPSTLISLTNLAVCYLEAGKSEEAVALLDKAAKLSPKSTAFSNQNSIAINSNLAVAFFRTGNLQKALPLFEETLSISKKHLGLDHPKTLLATGNLAMAYLAMGQVDRAISMHKATYNKMSKSLGPHHPDTLTSMQLLARGYRAANRLNDAISLFEQTVDAMVTKFGRDDRRTLVAFNELAVAYFDARRLDDALPLLEETLNRRRAIWGVEKQETLQSMDNFAACLRDLGQLDKALPLWEEAVETSKRVLGLEHPVTLSIMANLASGYWSARRFDMSIPILEQVVEIQEKRFGRKHPETLFAIANLGVNYKDSGKLGAAVTTLEEVFGASRRIPALVWVRDPLRETYLRAKQDEKFEALAKTELARARASLPSDSRELAAFLLSLGNDYLVVGDAQKSQPILAESLTIHRSVCPDEWSTFQCEVLLGSALMRIATEDTSPQSRVDLLNQAEALLVAGYKGMMEFRNTVPPQATTQISEALDRLIELYSLLKNEEKLEEYRQLRKQLPER